MKKWHSLIMANQQELAKVMTLENGKPLRESMGEINYGADYIEFYAEQAKRIDVSFKYQIQKCFSIVKH